MPIGKIKNANSQNLANSLFGKKMQLIIYCTRCGYQSNINLKHFKGDSDNGLQFWLQLGYNYIKTYNNIHIFDNNQKFNSKKLVSF